MTGNVRKLSMSVLSVAKVALISTSYSPGIGLSKPRPWPDIVKTNCEPFLVKLT